MIIGFTVGVWDTFHTGHENFLGKCREACDFLHVGIMTDFWCHVQKGHDRPYWSLQKRMRDLRQTGLADNIVILDTLDMSKYLQMVHIWFKGADQKNMLPLDYGHVIFIERTPAVSTTDNIERLRRTK